MQITGPYSPVSGTPIEVLDPARYIAANDRVQIQNYSGDFLTAVIGGGQFAIAPFTVATVPTNQASLLILNPTASLAISAGNVLLAWLQPGEAPPISDGPLSVQAKTYHNLTVTVVSANITYDLSGGFPSDRTLTMKWNFTGGGALPIVKVTGDQSSTVYFNQLLTIATFPNYQFTFAIDGSTDNSYTISFGAGNTLVVNNLTAQASD